jgi:histidyl-tRNA synthetase
MKSSLPQGTRDFAAAILHRRRFIIQTIQHVFELYGFEPLETPSLENLDTLMGKYGEEGDKLIFKILNNGLDHPSKKEMAIKNFENILEGKSNKNITERALRYDLTIPFARYMAMNSGKLTIPFKRYQIQNVWRADRPQKGRYREFLQCDADIAGTYSLISDAELACIYVDVFDKLKIDVSIKINSRKILYALAELTGNVENMNAITIAIDKLDKIGIDKVKEELLLSGLSENNISLIEKYINIEGTNEEKLEKMEEIASSSETGKKGIAELKLLLEYLNQSLSVRCKQIVPTGKQVINIDFALARGLNYYTGTIYEVKAKNVEIGSIGGGGRYDDLTGLFGVPAMPGVGISFGVDRIYDVMDELKLFPENIDESTTALFFNLGEKESLHAFKLMQQLRENQISSELFYENSKLEKQFKYASKKNIRYVVIIGSKEMEEKTSIIKDLEKGEQQTISENQLVDFFKNVKTNDYSNSGN